MRRSEQDTIFADLRDGRLREIGPKIKKLNAKQARVVSDEASRHLREIVANGSLSPAHRWLATALQFLAPPQAATAITEALKQAIRLKGCCGCTLNRLMRALGTIRPPEAIPSLVDVMCRAERPVHRHLAAVCIEKIVGSRGAPARELLRAQTTRLRRELNHLENAAARTRPVTPPKPWMHIPGSPGWFDECNRAAKAISRLLEQCGT